MKRLKMQNIQNQRRCGNKGLDAAEGHKYTNSLVPCYQHPNVATKNRFGFPSAKRFQGLLREQIGFCTILCAKNIFPSISISLAGAGALVGHWVFCAPPSMN